MKNSFSIIKTKTYQNSPFQKGGSTRMKKKNKLSIIF